jgi:hypothetical protein
MNTFKNPKFLKLISIVLVLTFSNLDVVWAYSEVLSSDRNLAVWSNFQQTLSPQHFEPLNAISSKKDLIAGLAVISKFLFGEDERGKGKFGRLAGVVREQYGETLSDFDVDRIFPMRYLEECKEAKKLGQPRPEFDYSRIVSDDDAVVIPYKYAGRTSLILISKRGAVKADDIMGYEWKSQPLKDYLITVLPVDYDLPQSWDESTPLIKYIDLTFGDIVDHSTTILSSWERESLDVAQRFYFDGIISKLFDKAGVLQKHQSTYFEDLILQARNDGDEKKAKDFVYRKQHIQSVIDHFKWLTSGNDKDLESYWDSINKDNSAVIGQTPDEDEYIDALKSLRETYFSLTPISRMELLFAVILHDYGYGKVPGIGHCDAGANILQDAVSKTLLMKDLSLKYGYM